MSGDWAYSYSYSKEPFFLDYLHHLPVSRDDYLRQQTKEPLVFAQQQKETEMNREERVRYWLEHNNPMNVFERAEWRNGIQELSQKATAWDALLPSLEGSLQPSQYAILKSKMAELVEPPKPKSKLERLEDLIQKGNLLHTRSYKGEEELFYAKALLSKIQELKNEPED